MATVLSTTPSGDPGGGDDPGPNLALIIGVAAGALVVMVIIILLILWRTGKLRKRRRSSVLRRPRHGNHSNDPLREERKKSIIVVAPAPKEGAELYIVRHFYAAEDDNQLTLESGRIIEVVEKMDNGWWRGVTGESEGWFPASFVRRIDVSDPTGGNISPDTVAPSMPTESPPSTWSSRKQTTETPQSSSNEGAFVNGGFSTTDVVDAGKSAGTCTSEKRGKKAKKDKAGKSVERSESERINSMGKQDIEGYLNEIFTVEDETTQESASQTPEIKRNKKSPKNKKLSLSEPSSLSKKKKNLVNSKKLQEQAVYNNKTTAENKKNSRMTKSGIQRPGSTGSLDLSSTNGVKGSPLINPVHYMISSSESLISSTSGLEDSERLRGMDSADEGPSPSRSEEVKVTKTGVKAPREENNGARGAPDGSSLVEVLPDGHGKELTSHKVEELGNQDEMKELGTATNGIKLDQSLMSNLKDQLRNRVSQPTATPQSSEQRQSFVAMYPFSPSDDTQLTLARNDVVFALGAEENGWVKGEKRGSREVGWFPKSYVREGKSPPGHADVMSEESEAADSDGEFDQLDQSRTEYRALYPYTAQQDGDLTIAEGDIIVVMETLDSGWWRGCHCDQEGWFPGSYVEPVSSGGSPFRSGRSSSAGSPAKTADKSKRQSLPTHLEDAVTPDVQSQVPSAATSQSPQRRPPTENSPSKRQSMPPLGQKPEVPTRYVAPNGPNTQRTQHRKGGDKLNSKPSRPPPPIPKNGPDPSRLNSLPGQARNVKISQLKRIKPDAFHSTDKRRRESFPRPSDPPPPVPSASSSETSPAHSNKDTVFLEESPRSAFLNSIDDTDDEDILLTKLKKSSLPGVHRGSHSSSGSDGNVQSVSVVAESTPVAAVDMEENSGEKLMGESVNPGDSSLSFNAIMNIFEKIADKGDSSANSLDSGEDESNNPVDKPSLPPKPGGKTEHRDTDTDSSVSGALSRKKPTLPPRPANGPQRSVSTGALTKLPSNGKLGLSEMRTSSSDQRLSAHVSTRVTNAAPTVGRYSSDSKPPTTFKPPRPSYLPMRGNLMSDHTETNSSELTNSVSSSKSSKDNSQELKLSSSQHSNGHNGYRIPESPVTQNLVDNDRCDTVHLGRGLEVVGGLLKDTNEISDGDGDSPKHTEIKALEVQDSAQKSQTITSQNAPIVKSTYSPPVSLSEDSNTQDSERQSATSTQPHRGLVTSPLSIKTNPMRFFSPTGYARSPSPCSSVSSTPLSSLTLSPLSIDSAVSPPTATGDHPTTTSPTRSSSENLTIKSRLSPTSPKDSRDPLRFYTPAGFTPRRGSAGEAPDVSKWLQSETPITNSLPSLFYDGMGNKGEDDTSCDQRLSDRRNGHTPKWHKRNSDDVGKIDPKGHQQRQDLVHTNGHTPPGGESGHYGKVHPPTPPRATPPSSRERTPPHAALPSSGEPTRLREGREFKAAMSQQLKLVALKSDDLESDV